MRLKSLLLVPVLSALSIIAAYAALQFAGGSGLAWLGVVLASAPLPGAVLAWMAMQNVARTSANLVPGWVAIAIGFAVVLWAGAPAVPLGLATVSALAFAWYIFSYSRFDRQPSQSLVLGEKLPDFSLYESDGEAVNSSEFAGHPTLFIFFRGDWCPLCMAQIKEVAAAYRRLAETGVEVALVSGQTEKQTKALAARFDVPFRFLMDDGFQAARQLGVFADSGTPTGLEVLGHSSDTMLPTVVATDASGKVIFLDQTDNYRVRPEPETFLRIFEQHTNQEAVA